MLQLMNLLMLSKDMMLWSGTEPPPFDDWRFSTFGPHTGHVVTYVPFVEGMRKIVLAVKAAVVPYFIMIGGTGSTILKSEGVNCCDSTNFWVKVFP
jgi:hypothetical protein